ncbi:AraC family transcriptional regulator [Fodinibius roseus]|nr:AraC family transcriptional regulator [Fodinibius roseus]
MMKAQLINRTINPNKSFNLESHSYKSFLQVWHYHPEVELTFILEGTGTRFIGDSIEKFSSGEIVLIGKNLPHLWLYDNIYLEEDSNLKAKNYVIHFHEQFPEGLLEIPEMTCINDLLVRASRGIRFKEISFNYISQTIDKIFELPRYDKVITLLELLKYLSEQKEFSMLSSAGYVNSFRKRKNSKIVPVYEYIMNNFKNGICLDNAAELANMNPSAFSRYFKRIHKKTFTRYVNEVRIGYACKLLMEQKFNISEVCYESGFNNVSNFNRQFKSLKEMTPTEFIQMHERID